VEGRTTILALDLYVCTGLRQRHRLHRWRFRSPTRYEKLRRELLSKHREQLVEFHAHDGMRLNLVRVRGANEATRGPVVLVHGAGVRAHIFRAPVATTLVDALVEEGYDVWLENWRASIDVAPNEWTLDQAAHNDHPAAIRKIVEVTGARNVKAVVHCQGSTSFTMAAVAGLVPEVDTIVSNAVSLHPVVPAWSKFKLNVFVPVTRMFTPFVNPHWGVHAPTKMAKAVRFLVRSFHHECDNDVCKLVSFTYGSGGPALWRHENLSNDTHEWLKEEFGAVPLRFHAQMAKCVARGHLVSVESFADLPEDFVASPPKTNARFSFIAGQRNQCFLAESQVRSHHYFSTFRPGFHTLHTFPDYGHLDIFMGSRAAAEVFPTIVEQLGRSSNASAGPQQGATTREEATST